MMFAECPATDLAALLVAIMCLVSIVCLGCLSVVVVKTMRRLRSVADDFERRSSPVLADLERAVLQANDELARADSLLDVTESISISVDQASRIAYLALSNPVIKTMALASGVATRPAACARAMMTYPNLAHREWGWTEKSVSSSRNGFGVGAVGANDYFSTRALFGQHPGVFG